MLESMICQRDLRSAVNTVLDDGSPKLPRSLSSFVKIVSENNVKINKCSTLPVYCGHTVLLNFREEYTTCLIRNGHSGVGSHLVDTEKNENVRVVDIRAPTQTVYGYCKSQISDEEQGIQLSSGVGKRELRMFILQRFLHFAIHNLKLSCIVGSHGKARKM